MELLLGRSVHALRLALAVRVCELLLHESMLVRHVGIARVLRCLRVRVSGLRRRGLVELDGGLARGVRGRVERILVHVVALVHVGLLVGGVDGLRDGVELAGVLARGRQLELRLRLARVLTNLVLDLARGWQRLQRLRVNGAHGAVRVDVAHLVGVLELGLGLLLAEHLHDGLGEPRVVELAVLGELRQVQVVVVAAELSLRGHSLEG